MKAAWRTVVLLWGVFLSGASVAAGTTIEVGLIGSRVMTVEAREFEIRDAATGEFHLTGRGAWKVRHLWGSAQSGPRFRLEGERADGRIGDINSTRDLLLVPSEGGGFVLEGRPYRGTLLLRAKDNYTSAVNRIDLEDYVRAVLPAEIGDYNPAAALEAQAVAARSWAMNQAGKHRSQGYDFCTRTHCQAYLGRRVEKESTNRAVDNTRGLVLCYVNGDGEKEIVNAVYTHSCGGVLHNAEGVWGPERLPYFKAHFDGPAGEEKPVLPLGGDALRKWLTATPGAWCNHDHNEADCLFRWVKRLEESGQGRIARRNNVGSRLRDLVVLRRAPSGHVTRLKIVGDRGEVVVGPQYAVRAAIGNINSTLFVVERDGASLLLRGGGSGHGVGLCQEGAIGMAHAGKTSREILEHYYPECRLETLPEGR